MTVSSSHGRATLRISTARDYTSPGRVRLLLSCLNLQNAGLGVQSLDNSVRFASTAFDFVRSQNQKLVRTPYHRVESYGWHL